MRLILRCYFFILLGWDTTTANNDSLCLLKHMLKALQMIAKVFRGQSERYMVIIYASKQPFSMQVLLCND